MLRSLGTVSPCKRCELNVGSLHSRDHTCARRFCQTRLSSRSHAACSACSGRRRKPPEGLNVAMAPSGPCKCWIPGFQRPYFPSVAECNSEIVQSANFERRKTEKCLHPIPQTLRWMSNAPRRFYIRNPMAYGLGDSHPVLVTTRNNGDYIRVCYTTVTGWQLYLT